MYTKPNVYKDEIQTVIAAPCIVSDVKEIELSEFEVSGTGKIDVRNTGGSSASEGGMGTGGGPEKGAGIEGNEGQDKPGTSKEEADDTWDPLKPKEEKGKEKS
jgi:hypothetical protein